MGSGKAYGPILWPVVMVAFGIILLLDNFLLLGDFNTAALLPLILVIAGAQILLRGDLFSDSGGTTFGITRGSVESAALEINSGAVDVDIRPLGREGRLIAGQFAAGARPVLDVQDTHAQLKMNRANTPWYAFGDWQVRLAQDLPWQLYVSTHLGQAHLDLSALVIQDVMVATGIGEIRLTAPLEALGQIHLRSALGDIHVKTPPGYHTVIVVNAGWMFRVNHDEYRYQSPEPGVYVAVDADEQAPLVEIYVSGTFGDAYLA